MAKFLPDSVTYTMYKRAKRMGKRRGVSEVSVDDFINVARALVRYGARRKAQKARAEFYKKHGYYQQ